MKNKKELFIKKLKDGRIVEFRDVDEDRLTDLIMDDVTNRLEETLRAYFNSGTRIVKMV